MKRVSQIMDKVAKLLERRAPRISRASSIPLGVAVGGEYLVWNLGATGGGLVVGGGLDKGESIFAFGLSNLDPTIEFDLDRSAGDDGGATSKEDVN